MPFKVSAIKVIMACAVLLVAGGLERIARAQPISRGRPIEFSSPKNMEAATNLHELNNKKSEFKTFEADRLKGFNQGSLDGMMAPMAPSSTAPVIQSKRVRELLDQKKNWIFMNPDEFGSSPTPESIFNLSEYGADGQEKKKGSVLEEFIQRQQGDKKDKTKLKDPVKERERLLLERQNDPKDDDIRLADDPNLPDGIRQSQQNLKKQISTSGSDTAASESMDSSPRSSLSDFFKSYNKESQSADSFEKQKSEISKQYHPFTSASSLGNSAKLFESLGTGTGLAAPATAPTSLDAISPAAKRIDTPETTAPGLSSALSGSALTDLGGKALTQWNPITPSLPQYETPKIAAPVTIPEFPRRKFY